MNVFTDVYTAMIDLLKLKSLESSWESVETELKILCRNEGPNAARSDSLRKARDKIDAAVGIWDYVSFNAATARAKEILKAAQTKNVGFAKRAAMLKTFYHFYFVEKKGNQSIWVVDHPKAYTKWAFDQLENKSEKDLKTVLQQEEEVFGSSNRKMMSDSLQLAKKWCLDIVSKLGKPDTKTQTVIKRWFLGDAATEEQVKNTTTILLEGFKKIANATNSTTVIFSDRPHLRTSGNWDDAYASVNEGDVMPVIYIYQLFLTTGKRTFFGNIPKLWLCALTVVHELSHKLQKTKDISYDYQGLKPGGTLGVSDAINNADSWGYFAADVVNVLSQATITDVLK